jgi:hypothetical protein
LVRTFRTVIKLCTLGTLAGGGSSPIALPVLAHVKSISQAGDEVAALFLAWAKHEEGLEAAVDRYHDSTTSTGS